jgi:hypothetical protein
MTANMEDYHDNYENCYKMNWKWKKYRYFCIKGVKEAILARGTRIIRHKIGSREMQTLFFVKS